MIFGVYLLPLSEATGTDIVTTSVYMTINGWGMALTAIVWGWLLSKLTKNSQFKIICIAIAVFGVLGPLWNASIAPQFGIWGYYIGSAIFSMSGGSLIVMIPLMMISNWFAPKVKGKVFGFASASGIIGSLTIPPIFTVIVQSAGLNMTFLLHAIIMGIFTIIPCALIFRKRDEDVLPWGVKSWEELEESSGGDASNYGLANNKIFSSIPFWLMLICMITLTIHGGLGNNTVGATGYWLGLVGSPEAANFAMIGALMMSVGAIAETVSKIVAGVIIDKWGPAICCAIFMLVPVLGMLIWVFVPASLASLYIGAILFGMIPATIIVAMPMLGLKIFGERTFPVTSSYISAVNTFLSGIMSPVVAWMIVVGNYSTPFLVACGLWTFAAIIFIITGRYVGKLPWVDAEGNPMPGQEVVTAAK
jgi:MFS family permease